MRAAALAAGAMLALVAPAAPPSADPHTLLERADRVRNAWKEAVLTLRVTTEKPGASPSAGTFDVAVKNDNARIEFKEKADAGKVFLSVGDEAWLILPNTRNPIKVPKAHRLSGGFAAADVSRTRFAEDYDAVVERTDVLDGRECVVLRLIAKKGKNPSYPVVRVWVDPKEGLYRRAVFLVASGRTAKEVGFDSYRPYHGVLSLERMTIVDVLRPGKTVVEYLDYQKKELPDALFDPRTSRQGP